MVKISLFHPRKLAKVLILVTGHLYRLKLWEPLFIGIRCVL